MEAPVCRTCGHRHWSRVCQGKPVALPVALQKPRNVTAPRDEVTALTVDLAAMKAEVARLTLALASRACPECERRRAGTAERVRKSRARQP